MVRSSGDMEEGLGALSPKIVREASMKHGVPCCCRSLKAAAPMILMLTGLAGRGVEMVSRMARSPRGVDGDGGRGR